jgi:hypothetical protein
MNAPPSPRGAELVGAFGGDGSDRGFDLTTNRGGERRSREGGSIISFYPRYDV